MQKDPFLVLGVERTVTQSELYEAYKKMREPYLNKRFEPGEEGTKACEKLDEIEEAYRLADDELKSRFFISQYDDSHSIIDDLIKQGRLDEAQAELDKLEKRDAEWHFLQSMVFYRKKWFSDAHEQLKTAVDMEPNNVKYTSALKNFEAKVKTNNTTGTSDQNNFYNNINSEDSRHYRNTAEADAGRTACNICQGLICADCCCECMGGDLIACC